MRAPPMANLVKVGLRTKAGSEAISVPHLRLQLKLDELELGFRIGHSLGGQKSDVGEVDGKVEPARQLADVVTVAGDAFDLDHPFGLLKAGQPQSARVPGGIVDGAGIVLAQLGEGVGVDGGAAPAGGKPRQLEENGGGPGAGGLQLAD